MPDVVVTVPMNFRFYGAPAERGLAAWIAEGDAAGEPATGQEWEFSIGRGFPNIRAGEQVYVVCQGRLRGYAPLIRISEHIERAWIARIGEKSSRIRYGLIRGGDAVAVTIAEAIPGFRGFRYRWWARELERPFPDWKECPAKEGKKHD